ncbi:MAG TPA: hypothetical protein VL242_03220, partial [Sorangium sp.]|nr:hypothetical protein [Sorangium sp.]
MTQEPAPISAGGRAGGPLPRRSRTPRAAALAALLLAALPPSPAGAQQQQQQGQGSPQAPAEPPSVPRGEGGAIV